MAVGVCHEYRKLAKEYDLADASYASALRLQGWESASVNALRDLRAKALEAMVDHERTHRCVRTSMFDYGPYQESR